MKTITTFYDNEILDKYSCLCIDSWLENNYNVIIYVKFNNFKINNPLCTDVRISVMEISDLCNSYKISKNELIKEKDGIIYLDTNIFLYKTLPIGSYNNKDSSVISQLKYSDKKNSDETIFFPIDDLGSKDIYEKINNDIIFKKLKNYYKFNYKICIPSYRRASFCYMNTYRMLKTNNIPSKSINIFVSDMEDYLEYKELYTDINVVLIPDKYKGIGAVRSYITNSWANDKDEIVFIDDDIEYIKENEIERLNIKTFIPEFFNRLHETGLYFGGLQLCANTYFFKNNWTTTLKYCSGAFQCIRINKDRQELFTSYRHYEDYWFNLAYFHRDGGILRYNNASPITKNYNIHGGICEECGSLSERLKDCDIVADEIIKEFGRDAVKKYHKKKSARGPACLNLRLNWFYKI